MKLLLAISIFSFLAITVLVQESKAMELSSFDYPNAMKLFASSRAKIA